MTGRRRNPVATQADDVPRRQIGFLIRKFYQKNQAIWQELCVDEQMTSVQHAALSSVLRTGPCSLTVLGRTAAMDPATTRGVVERLRMRGMISLIGDPADKRKVIVQLEQPGRDFLTAMAPALEQISDETLQPLNPAERVALEFLLRRVTATDD